jgi:hypothetical protein
MVRVSQVLMGGDDGGSSSQVRDVQDTSGAKDVSGTRKVQGRNPGQAAAGGMESAAAAIDTRSWNIEVHKGMPLVQESSIRTGLKAPAVHLVKLLGVNGLALTSAAVVLLSVAGLGLSLKRVQRCRSGACSRGASRSVSAGLNRSPAYAQLREALQERFQVGDFLDTKADTA